MDITPKIDFMEGGFDTKNVKMLCIANKNHGTVDLCINEPDCCWNIPIGKIVLHSRNLYVDFKDTLQDAKKLGDEIARRWNECIDKQ